MKGVVDITSWLAVGGVGLLTFVVVVQVMGVVSSPSHLCEQQYGDSWTAQNESVQNMSSFTCINTQTGETAEFDWPENLTNAQANGGFA